MVGHISVCYWLDRKPNFIVLYSRTTPPNVQWAAPQILSPTHNAEHCHSSSAPPPPTKGHHYQQQASGNTFCLLICEIVPRKWEKMSGAGKKVADVALKASRTIDWDGMAKLLVTEEARKEFATLRRAFDEVNSTLQTKFSQVLTPPLLNPLSLSDGYL